MFLDKFFEESRFRRICNSNKQSRGGQISGAKLILTEPRRTLDYDTETEDCHLSHFFRIENFKIEDKDKVSPTPENFCVYIKFKFVSKFHLTYISWTFKYVLF